MDNVSIEFKSTEALEFEAQDINYIPSYKIAEQERRASELERKASEIERESNETERETYYEDFKAKVESGYFKGEKGDKGETGNTGATGQTGADGKDGADGYTPVRGTDYWTTEDIATIEEHCNSYIDSQLGTINEQLASLTEVSE